MKNFTTFPQLNENELNTLPISTLAWVGDAVYSLIAREFELSKFQGKPNKLHKMATSLVNAKAQSDALDKIAHTLNEREQSIVRRARNSPITTKSKNYGLAEYKKATGLEALFGYLYLSNKQERIDEILNIILGE